MFEYGFDDDVYSGYEEGAVSEIEGITDKVSDMTFTNVSYPAIIFKDGIQLPQHKVLAISNMVKSSAGNTLKDITLYMQNEGQLYKMGMLSGNQVMPLLDITGVDSIIAYYSEGKELRGNKIYVLCNFTY